MNNWWRPVVGAVTIAGGLFLFLGSLPPRWFGYQPGDSYVFDPVAFSPIWIERVLLPALTFLGTIGLLIGVAGLVYRDWQASRLLRWAGGASLLGGVAFLAGIYGPDFLGPAGATVGPISGLAGFALALWGLLLIFVGGPLFAYAYLRLGNRVLGWALLTFVPVGLLLGWLLPGGSGDVVGSVPWLILTFVVAWDLRDRPG